MRDHRTRDPKPERDAAASRPAGESSPFWRSLDELAGSDAFLDTLEREFPRQAVPLGEGVDRRRFLQLMGGSLALGGLGACTRQPLETIVPYVRQPEEIVPGKPLYFATAATLGGYATGVLVESHMGRPTKIEGNPQHPASLGATDVLTQASVLDLYDPHRSQAVRHLGRIRTWSAFVDSLATALGAQEGTAGAGLRILTETVTSPTLAAQMDAVRQRFSRARWVQYDPAGRHLARAGARAAFGSWAEVHYDLSRARVILALDCDLLAGEPGSVRYARQFAQWRRVWERREMNRLYAVESTPTPTGTLADHRLRLRPERIEALALALAAEMGLGATPPAGLDRQLGTWARAVAQDLLRHPGESLVVAGEWTSPELHVLAHAMNQRLGNFGSTVHATAPVAAAPSDQIADLAALADDLRQGRVEVLLILGGNPVYDAPADLGFADALRHEEARLRIHYGLVENETSAYCHWHIPATHYLEAWGDARAFDGTVTIQQPLIEPLYGSRSPHELLAIVEGRPGALGYDIVREHWLPQLGSEAAWRRALHEGTVPDTALPAAGAAAGGAVAAAVQRLSERVASPAAEYTLLFRPDPTLWDGRFAGNAWLQECPKPFTKLTWDNALLVSPATARQLGIDEQRTGRNRDRHPMVRVTVGASYLEVPVWITPGQADGAVTLHLGHGRTRGGPVAEGHGFDAYRLRTRQGLWQQRGVSLQPTGEAYALASTQGHFSMENRHLVREATVAEYADNPGFVHAHVHAPDEEMTLYPKWEYAGYAWGMGIDLSSCTGCNACVVACQSENNIAVVGKEQVLAGREMHWLRIDQYFKGPSADEPEGVYNQPVPCMHCETAPCEVVCPVAATVHSDEGLNDMVYNRCVGTRYCSNNCPYKVRRFNFYKFSDWQTESLKLQRNPDVSVRFRGVMEKCTYCVQRINHARIAAGREDRSIADGEIQTACQQACPTGAIVFGDINDASTEVARWKAQPLDYGLLEDVNTRPRTTYMGRIRNPNPELEA
ncbi:MAG TPA: TAT-variant-translocated molybdopterin oxidoreductase [Thermoanaerobaculia bacterium]|nr:TAT-variant-translocated molybdopterin oxidoreductase [Thermoanaerobaculia bacterium]